MSNIYTPPPEYDPSNPDRMRVENRVEEAKEQPGQLKNIELETRSELMLSLAIMNLLENRIEDFLSGKKERDVEDYEDIELVLSDMKTQLLRLKVHNVAEDYLFAQRLSDLWHALRKHMAEIGSFRKKPVYFDTIKIIIHQIESYPEKVEHSLGYYLTEYAGEKWLPFPFIDLLSGLHEEAIVKKNKSHLSDWILAIETILQVDFEEEREEELGDESH